MNNLMLGQKPRDYCVKCNQEFFLDDMNTCHFYRELSVVIYDASFCAPCYSSMDTEEDSNIHPDYLKKFPASKT